MKVAAHLIVGAREEPFLPALLASLDGVTSLLIVNDNSGNPSSVNARVLAASAFAARDALVIDRAPFVNFAEARNRVLALHRAYDAGPWAAFVDADEVHRPAAARIAARLADLPPEIATVDGYTRHYLQSFSWYTSIERRLSFFRVTPELRWVNPVHEKLANVAGRPLVIPYVYDHYGFVLPQERQAAKGRQYAHLGQSGETYDDAQLAALDPGYFFRDFWPRALRFRGSAPPALGAIRAQIEARDAARIAFADEQIARVQSAGIRAQNVLRRCTFEYRWRGRMLDPLARKLVAGTNAFGAM